MHPFTSGLVVSKLDTIFQ